MRGEGIGERGYGRAVLVGAEINSLESSISIA
jgi:hypothetical protein